MLLDGHHPIVDVGKRLLAGHIVHEQYPHRAAVVSGRDCLESLLARRIPNLQLDPLAIQRDGADLEVDAVRARRRRAG